MHYYLRNLRITQYDADAAVKYAHKWAFKRNPKYLDFENFGGDCTNFASQTVYAGSRVMNFTPVYGWFYIDGNNRTASWTGVNFFYNFLVKNKGMGPFAEEADIRDLVPGDIIQLSFQGKGVFNHSLVVVQTGIVPAVSNILVSTHTLDRDNYPLRNYSWIEIRFIHIKGVRMV